MTIDAPTPDNNILLRQMRGTRRDMQEMMEREARTIDLVNRLILRVDEGFARMREEMSALRRDLAATHSQVGTVHSDLVLMENRILTAITEVRRLAERVDKNEDTSEDLS